jgi:K+-transporting ATPase c subunit
MSLLSISSIQQAFNGTYNGTKTGTVTDSTQGSGTYSNTVSHQDGVATFDDVTTYANGNTAETKTSITKNADGSFDETIQKYVDGKQVKSESLTTSADGSSVTKSFQLYNAKGKVAGSGSEVITGNPDGSESITGTQTWANGSTDQISGSLTQTGTGVDQNITVTNAAGQTATRAWQYSKNGTTSADSLTYTDFAGTSQTDTTTRTQVDS